MTGRIEPAGFHAVSGTIFAIAILAAVSRTVARWQRFQRLFVDDIFFFLSVATLIGGSTMLYINISWAYEQERVSAGSIPPPPDFLSIILEDAKTQFASSTLIGTTIVAVKFSFLSFFYLLIQNTKPWYRVWWIVVTLMTLASAPMVMFSDFIACPYSGPAILENCISDAALARENAVVKASVALDIISDVLIISIPVIILWNVQMELRKKLVLAASLCMGIFMIVCACVRIGAANLPNGEIDVLWTLLWQQLEACVAVIVVSLTAFRMLFTSTVKSDLDALQGKRGKPTRRDRYESEGRSQLSHWGGCGESVIKNQMSETKGNRESSQSLDAHELKRVHYQNLG